jgi:hypothetical protein
MVDYGVDEESVPGIGEGGNVAACIQHAASSSRSTPVGSR